MKIISWNVNGIRSAHKKGFLNFLDTQSPDILGIQEVRAEEEVLPDELRSPDGYSTVFSAAEKKGYSGVAIFSRTKPIRTWTSLGAEEFDREGRVLAADFEDFILYNVYFPNGSGKRDNSRVPYKLDFYEAMLTEINGHRAQGREIIIMGDYNTAHRELDLARPKQNRGTSGFLPEECEVFEGYLETGLVDTFRHVHGDKPDSYTWWSFRSGARARNVGWRIDYILVTPGLIPGLKSADILNTIMGSDHCPIEISLKEN